MKKGLIISVIVCLTMVVFVAVFSRLKSENVIVKRDFQHEEFADVDSSIGTDTIPSDGIIDKDEFVTHLPIVIIDTNGEKIPDIYENDDDGNRYYADDSVTEAYIDATITLINNDNSENHITDTAELVNNGKIKLRGNSSRDFAKKNYGIKLLDENGEELEKKVLGMDADEDWVLSNSILDASLIRNYIAYNIGGLIFPYTSECKFCEVILKDGDSYQYQGLYLLTESIKKADGRVGIENYDESQERLSFMIKRDRKDFTGLTLNTWASDSQLCYGYFTVKYPKQDVLSKDAISRIENELSQIEKVIYSDNVSTFKNYSKYIDVDSFVDYFVFNEFMMCYDSGNNSTYYYQDSNHKLSMGPLWDYDNCLDNYKSAVGDPEYMVYVEKPWFERLIKDSDFQDKLIKRYKELRLTILSDKYIEEFIDETVAYIGNAAYRDRTRWAKEYQERHLLHVTENGHDFVIDRNCETYEDEIIRLKDTQKLHGSWMDKYMKDFLTPYLNKDVESAKIKVYSYIAVALIGVFIVSLAVVRKKLYE